MAREPAHAFAPMLKTFKTASGKAGKYWSLKELAKPVSYTHLTLPTIYSV